MAALAGAIVVGGGVNTYAEGDNTDNNLSMDEISDAYFDYHWDVSDPVDPSSEEIDEALAKALAEAKETAKKHIDSLNHLSETAKKLAKNDIDAATTVDGIKGITASADVMERKTAEKEQKEKEAKKKAEEELAAAKEAAKKELTEKGKLNTEDPDYLSAEEVNAAVRKVEAAKTVEEVKDVLAHPKKAYSDEVIEKKKAEENKKDEEEKNKADEE